MLRRLLPHRDEALRAVALVAARGEDLAPGLARLAADDRLLGPWARRLVRAAERSARRGESGTGTVLRRAGLLEANEAACVDEAERAGDASVALQALAARGGWRVSGLWALEWFPLLVLVAACGAMLLAKAAMRPLLLPVFADMGIRLPGVSEMVLRGPVWSSALPILLIVGTAAFLLAVRLHLGLPFCLFGVAWYPSVKRDACLLQMLPLARVRLATAELSDLTLWEHMGGLERRVCRLWRELGRFVTPAEQWFELKAAPLEADALLRAGGLLPREGRVPAERWGELTVEVRTRLERTLAPRLAFCWLSVWLTFIGIVMLAYFAAVAPVVDIVNQLG